MLERTVFLRVRYIRHGIEREKLVSFSNNASGSVQKFLKNLYLLLLPRRRRRGEEVNLSVELQLMFLWVFRHPL
jgi:hypothetical protein